MTAGLAKSVAALAIVSFFCTVSATGSIAADVPERTTTRDGATMVLIPGGSFLMGSPEGEGLPAETPQHEVDLDPFFLDTTEVTNGRYAAFLNEIRAPEGADSEVWTWVVLRSDLEYPPRAGWWPTEVLFKGGKYEPGPGRADHPVITISWYGAKAYCEYFGKRLPTEAEWEKAARGGLEGKRFPWGDAFPTGGATFERRWATNSEPVPTTPVASYPPNGYGLYDMAGNVWEWCEDTYDEGYYKTSPKKNPTGANTRSLNKSLRGGSWFNPASFIRVAQRNFGYAGSTEDGIGVRCAMNADADALEKSGATASGAASPSASEPSASEPPASKPPASEPSVTPPVKTAE